MNSGIRSASLLVTALLVTVTTPSCGVDQATNDDCMQPSAASSTHPESNDFRRR